MAAEAEVNEITVPTTLPRYLLVPVQCLHLYLLVVMVSNIIFLKIKFLGSGSGSGSGYNNTGEMKNAYDTLVETSCI